MVKLPPSLITQWRSRAVTLIPQVSLLRQIVAGPRIQHPEAGLDLCYVTDNIVATSGPSSAYPQRAYRNPTDALVKWLDSKHGSNWAIWEFRAEGTGYPDSEVYNRIHHFPWPDHHPPPFALIPNIVGGMRNWVNRQDDKDAPDTGEGERIIVVHCKAGKGRSGTIACAYLISQEGWKKEDALKRFTERRMRQGFGAGVSIPSQLRWVGYVDRWTNELQKQYIERPVEILELHIWGLKDGVKVVVQGFEDEGKKIKNVHSFRRHERVVVHAGESPDSSKKSSKKSAAKSAAPSASDSADDSTPQSDVSGTSPAQTTDRTLSAVIYRPHKPIIVPGSDVNIDFERRSKVSYTGLALVTSLAHVWFNAYFEGGHLHESGVFEINWDAMDGVKGSYKKGIRALEKLKVVWRYPPQPETPQGRDRPVSEPQPGEPVQESQPADWRGQDTKAGDSQSEASGHERGNENRHPSKGAGSDTTQSISASAGGIVPAIADTVVTVERQLGLRAQTDASKDVSLAGTDDEARYTTDEEGQGRKKKDTQVIPVGSRV
ncbi:hypothetical protein N7468_008337 [Penicillium chermesinum]|uniref:phosphatidylinositol-3,4,5-trisphosphate 3-phosphatase n=1 Tax=Penicillium chermesinum TaxID=63820 RepID=A0A9W9NPJ1_9EURO|nr:uncharacterized protein N7468_008337 [Penicillium chermesinum]KAJ5223795.1 hypothetical protein N7468_008337 [Penicillium chermesinum]